jgi:hypothetical protein
MKKWTKPEEDFLSAHITEDPRETALLFLEKFGLERSQDSIRKKVNRLRETLPKTSDCNSPFSLLDPVIAKQQVQMWLRAVASESKGLSLSRAPTLKSNERSLVIVISDVHWGKKTKRFNMEIASQRILSIASTLWNTDLPEFDEIVVLLLGDLVEGEDVFAHQQSVIEAPVIAAHKKGTETIWKLLLTLKDLFGVPVRVECAYGNHGRMSKTAHPSSNWDNAIHSSLAMISQFSKKPGIQVNLCLDEFNLIDIKGVKTLLLHEAPKNLSTPTTLLKFSGWIISKDIDLLVSGHWHNFGVDKYLGRTRIANGSVPGADDLAEKIAREDPACQAYFFIDPEIPGYVSNINYIQW